MSTVAIIAEYNPFHNGHAYQISKAKELTGAENVIILMSGNYVQRGTPAILNKYSRAKSAVTNGASLVIELPVCYATAGAELFAYASVCLLDCLHTVDYLSFGCETDDFAALLKIASILLEEPEEYRLILKKYLSEGNSYPLAREKALSEHLKDEEIKKIIKTPNNILAIEYLKALKKINTSIIPIPVKRTDPGYHSKDVGKNFASASAIRALLKNGQKPIDGLVPDNTLALFHEPAEFMELDDFSTIMAKELIYNKNLSQYYDISPFLANRIHNSKNTFVAMEEFITTLLSKNETYAHINRALLHILLNITSDDIQDYIDNGVIFYLNVLAAKKSNTDILKKIKNNASLPIINKFGDFYRKQKGLSKKMLDININADSLYNYIYYTKTKEKLPNDFSFNSFHKYV